jgi:hypothetical protein
MHQRHESQQSEVQSLLAAAAGSQVRVVRHSAPSSAPCRQAGAFLFLQKR